MNGQQYHFEKPEHEYHLHPVESVLGITHSKISHFCNVVEAIEQHMVEALKSLGHRERSLVIHEYGLYGLERIDFPVRKYVRLRFRSKAAHKIAVEHALHNFNRHLEYHLTNVLHSHEHEHYEHDKEEIYDALHIVRGGDVRRAFEVACGFGMKL